MRLHPLLTGLALGLLCACLYLWGLGDLPFYTKGEPREGTIVWEIYTSGEWILPLRNGQIIPSKPPLFHWLGTLVSLSWGEVNELTIRLPSALLAVLGVLLTYGTGTALWGAEAGLTFVLIAGSWYGLALWKGGQAFFVKQILQENLLRFFASGEAGMGHEHPFYYFLPNLFFGMAPWSFFFPPLGVFLYQRRRTWAEDE